MAHIVVIGAGVIGLQTAVTLLEAGYTVTVIAKHYPGDKSTQYTSAWAGAVWRTHATSNEPEQCQWDLESYRSWMKIVSDEPETARKMGIEKYPLHIYSAIPGIDTSSPRSLYFLPHMNNASFLSASALPPGCKSGIEFDSIAINPNQYLKFLYSRVMELGARILQLELDVSKGIASVVKEALEIATETIENGLREDKYKNAEKTKEVSAVINCAGLSANSFCPDSNLYPIRGQTVLARLHPPPNPSSVRK